MLAFHGKQEIKDVKLAQLQAHYADAADAAAAYADARTRSNDNMADRLIRLLGEAE